MNENKMKTKKIFEDAQRLFVNGKYEESVRSFTRAMESGAESSLACLSRGVAYLKLGKMDEAISDFSKSIAENPGSTRGYYYRGMGYLARENYEAALPDLNRVIEMDPEHGAAHLARGTLYGLMGDDEKSVRDMKTAIIKSETQIQGFADTFGILRTQFHKAVAHVSGERAHDPALVLTNEEIEQVKKWLDAA